ncbi:hypothetical protein [Pedobacter cryophilus]|uniref:Tetratricopeptide repeat protein n=1 Tax=Pedobacter cryophilus TaxID=2571271 RepID=A0A4U1BYX4_9SPHI|nr:hypothetical protein [Pedobacter cryophilus]TKB95707.1 hypothetical protein FA046_15550 [Pedobacter cryophilus]
MKTFFLSLIILFSTATISMAYDMKKIREDYIAAISNSEKADKLCSELTAIKNPDALILAYLGSAQAIKAKHAWNPVNKMSYLKQGFKTIDKAIAKDPNHLEVRFLRFSLQYYVPTFLGYSKNIDTDKDKIIDLLKKKEVASLKLDKKILKDMVNFMIDSKKCDEQEIAILRKALA